jgi:pyruvate/2-oxoglutarate dehydrogenase complex dihydrolipoamide acyltransferase (E2) component
VVEIPSVFAGTITSIRASAGDTVEVGDVLFVIGEAAGEETSEVRIQNSESIEGEAGSRKPDAGPPAQESEPSPIAGAKSGKRKAESVAARPSSVKAMPLVRRLADERGVDLTAVTGTGPGGSITRADVESAQPAVPIDGDLIPLTATRRSIADHMSRSWREIPHVTVQAEIRAESLLAEMKVTGNALEACVARRILPVLHDFPDFNAAFTEQGIVRKSRHDIGFAIDTDAGLMVVVVAGADDKSVDELSTEFGELATSARDRTIALDQITGQTFTISNIGALGGGHGTPIIPIGTTAIMSIGRAKQQPVIEGGELTIGMVAPLDLSYDHRVIDGGLGQRFLSTVVSALEH